MRHAHARLCCWRCSVIHTIATSPASKGQDEANAYVTYRRARVTYRRAYRRGYRRATTAARTIAPTPTGTIGACIGASRAAPIVALTTTEHREERTVGRIFKPSPGGA